MGYFVYILYSKKLNKFYTGTTTDVERRLFEHNSGVYGGSFTTKGIPWILFLSIECMNSNKAYAFERFIKKMKSSAFIKKLREDQEMMQSILDKL